MYIHTNRSKKKWLKNTVCLLYVELFVKSLGSCKLLLYEHICKCITIKAFAISMFVL